MDEPEMAIEDQVAVAEEFTRGLVEAFGFRARVEVEVEDDAIHIDVTGDGLGLLVGQKGATLTAMEELVRTVVQRRTGGHGARLHLDVAQYRAKRRAALEEFTRTLVAKVRDSGRALALEPMSAGDRKTVHDTVAELDGVSTESEGEEPRRRVVIRPG